MTKSTTPRNIVLYADDDPDDLELVQESFIRYSNNVDVVTFRDGSQALIYLRNLTDLDPAPCLIIFDINMPVMSGKEALAQLRELERFKSIPVVLFTTSSMPLDKSFAKRYDAGFITKPLDVNQMEFITHEFIEHCTDEIKKNIRKYFQ